MEGLGQVVVGAQVQAQYLVIQGIAGGDDEHAVGFIIGFQLFKNVQAIAMREVDIQDDTSIIIEMDLFQGRHNSHRPFHR
jgi:hypothetical protein